MLEIQRVVARLDLARTQLLRRTAGAAIVGAEARTPGPAAAAAAVAVVGAEARTPRPAAVVAAVAVVGAGTWKPGHAAAVAPIVVARHPSPSIIRSFAAAILVASAAAVAIVTAVTAAAAAAAAAARRRPAGAVHAYRAFRAWGVALPADTMEDLEKCRWAVGRWVAGGKPYVEDPRPVLHTRTSAPPPTRICRRHSSRALASAVSRWMEVTGH